MTLASVSPQAASASKRQRGQILDAEQVRAIHRRCAAGEMRNALAAEYHVSSATVRSIIRGDSWKSINLSKLIERFEDRRVDLCTRTKSGPTSESVKSRTTTECAASCWGIGKRESHEPQRVNRVLPEQARGAGRAAVRS
jgi:hypothetical protein